MLVLNLIFNTNEYIEINVAFLGEPTKTALSILAIDELFLD